MAKVLVIDDEPSIATLVAEIIEGYGHEVTVAHNGKDGLELAKTGKYDLIISDIMMPYLNGQDLLECIKRDEKLAQTRFVLMSAVSQLMNHGQKPLPDAVIVKPFDITAIDKLVWSFLATSKPDRGFPASFPFPAPAMNNSQQQYANY